MLPSVTYPFPRHDALIAHLAELRPEVERIAKLAKPLALDKVKLLSPVANPGKIIAAPADWPAPSCCDNPMRRIR